MKGVIGSAKVKFTSPRSIIVKPSLLLWLESVFRQCIHHFGITEGNNLSDNLSTSSVELMGLVETFVWHQRRRIATKKITRWKSEIGTENAEGIIWIPGIVHEKKDVSLDGDVNLWSFIQRSIDPRTHPALNSIRNYTWEGEGRATKFKPEHSEFLAALIFEFVQVSSLKGWMSP